MPDKKKQTLLSDIGHERHRTSVRETNTRKDSYLLFTIFPFRPFGMVLRPPKLPPPPPPLMVLTSSTLSEFAGKLELKTAPTFKPKRINADAARASCQNATLCRFEPGPAQVRTPTHARKREKKIRSAQAKLSQAKSSGQKDGHSTCLLPGLRSTLPYYFLEGNKKVR